METNEINVNASFRTRGKVYIPAKVLARLELMGEVAGSDEYGMYLSADIDRARWEAHIDPDIFEIPPQRVSPGSIRMTEVPDDLYDNKWGERCYNAVVHRHPDSCNAFSPTDHNYINRFFEISFIYQKGFKVPKCIMNRKETNFDYTTLECDVVITDANFRYIEEVIKPAEPPVTSGVSIPEKVYPCHHEDHNRHFDFHGNHRRAITPVYSRRTRVMEEYEALKAEILATEPDMLPEALKKMFIRYGYTAEEMSEIEEVKELENRDPLWLGFEGGGANGNE
jgi:hypothetical protein